MSYLLDTHTLLWWLGDHPTLSEEARNIIAAPENIIFVSAASAWEIGIKKAIGKLEAPEDLETAIAVNHFETLPITITDGLSVEKLPNYHQDPFDRMLIAQAMANNLTIITRDSQFSQYGLRLILA